MLSSGSVQHIQALCTMYRNESAHTQKVCSLALKLFDAVAGSENLPARSRDLLEAAACLHDIAFASHPANHAVASAELVAGTEIRGFSAQERAMIAAVILLHGKHWVLQLKHPLFQACPEPKVSIRLAAILRVADGLDHGRLQDAQIQKTRMAPGLHCEVTSPSYPANAAIAQHKAGLWARAFEYPIQLTLLEASPSAGLYDRVLQNGDALGLNVRRLLTYLYNGVVDEIPGVLDGHDPEALHRMRIAVRRFRTACRVFRKPLTGTRAEELGEKLREETAITGPLRDLDVWINFLKELPGPSDQLRRAALKVASSEREAALNKVADHINSPAFSQIIDELRYFMRVGLCEWEPKAPAGSAKHIIAAELHRRLPRKEQLRAFRKKVHPDRLHQIRRAFRKARYVAELLQPVSGRKGHRIAAQLKRIAARMGDVRDAYLFLLRVESPDSPYPQELAHHIATFHQTAWRNYKTEKKRMIENKMLQKARKHLDQLEKKAP